MLDTLDALAIPMTPAERAAWQAAHDRYWQLRREYNRSQARATWEATIEAHKAMCDLARAARIAAYERAERALEGCGDCGDCDRCDAAEAAAAAAADGEDVTVRLRPVRASNGGGRG